MLETLIILLINIITIYFYKGKLLSYYKVIIIIVLKKAYKKDYSLLGNYQLITFKNILGKLLKKGLLNIYKRL